MSDPTTPTPLPDWLSPAQRRLVAVAVTALSGLFLAALVLGIGYTLQLFVATFSIIIWPLAISGILSLLLRPLVHYFERRLQLRRWLAIALLYVVVSAALTGMCYSLLPRVVNQVGQLVETAQTAPNRLYANLMGTEKAKGILAPDSPLRPAVETYLNPAHFNELFHKIGDHFQELVQSAPDALRRIWAFSQRAFAMAASIAVIPIYLFFLLSTDRDLTADLRQQLTFIKSSVRHDIIFLVEEFVGIMVAFFRGQLLIGLCLGVLKAIGFTIIGVKFGLVLGMLFGLLNVIPYLGTILGLATILPIAYFQDGGGLGLVFEAIGVFLVVQCTEGYFLTPKIMGQQTGLHPMVIIVSVFFWGEALNGILGMVLAVPLTAFLVVAWRLLRNKYLPKHGTGLTRPAIPMRSLLKHGFIPPPGPPP